MTSDGILERHGALYAEEYGWGAPFEALVAEVIAEFAREHDPRREACWLAELDGQRVGSVMLVRHPRGAGVARLAPAAGRARRRGGWAWVALWWKSAPSSPGRPGYRKVTLWTQSVLGAARAIYASVGYGRSPRKPNHEFGQGLIAETWETDL